MGLLKNKLKEAGDLTGSIKPKVSDQLLDMAHEESDAVLADLASRLSGLSTAEAETRVKRDGLN